MQASGEPYWAYLAVKPSRAKAFRDAIRSGQLQLQDYGEIICWGEGEDVPAEMRQKMEQEHRVNHTLQEEILAIAKQQRSKKKK
jgi:hypothetical protein